MTSPVDLTPEQGRSLWDKSQVCESIDIFISHSWFSHWWQKYLALLCHFCGAWALVGGCCGLVAVLAVSNLHAQAISTQDELLRLPVVGCGSASAGMWMLAVPAILLLALVCGLACSQLQNRMVFFDAACINQVDEVLKLKGINSLGGFVANSKELLVMWTPSYFSRMWCVYELAAFSAQNPGGKMTFCPLFSKLVNVFGMVAILTCVVVEAACWRLCADMPTLVLSLASCCYLTMVLLTHTCRPYMAQKKQLVEQLSYFDIRESRCREDADREAILRSVQLWFGSSDAFNEYVRGTLKEEVLSALPTSGLTYLDFLRMCAPCLCRSLCSHTGIAATPTTFIATSLFLLPSVLKVLVSLFEHNAVSCKGCVTNFARTLAIAAIGTLSLLGVLGMEQCARQVECGDIIFMGFSILVAALAFGRRPLIQI